MPHWLSKDKQSKQPETSTSSKKDDEVAVKEHKFQELLDSVSPSAKAGPQGASLESKFDDIEGRALKHIPQSVLSASSEDLDKLASLARDKIRHFRELSTVLIDALDTVSSLHPFISVAVMAFKGVVKFELKRHENNDKVVALQSQMHDMMSALRRLASISDSRHVGADGTTIEETLAPEMDAVAEDIMECGNVCDSYTKKRIISKMFKASIYERRMAEYGERFAKRRSSFDLILSVHTSVSVVEVSDKLDTLDAKTDELLKIFRRLDTPREREIRRYIEQKGDEHACLADDNILRQLVQMETGATLEKDKLFYVKKRVEEEINESIEKNLDRFIGNMHAMQEEVIGAIKTMESNITRQSNRVLEVLTHGPHARIVDKEIHSLWQEMHWRNSVKALHFTLALRDHLTEKFHGNHGGEHVHSGSLDDAVLQVNYVPPAEPPSGDERTRIPSPVDPEDGVGDDEQWAIDSFTMLAVPPISEALDDDGTGFISTREVNDFTSSRPADWSLLRWLVYWGEGWYASLVEYREKILRTMQRMYELSATIHPANRPVIDQYLGHFAFQSIELLMRGIDTSRPLAPGYALQHLRPYTDAEEERIRNGLEGAGYVIDDPITLELIKGPGRIERFIAPLLHLILRRHLEIMQSGRVYLLDERQLTAASFSLYHLRNGVVERIQRLSAVLRHSRADGRARLTTYAFGMFQHIRVDVLSEYPDDRPEDNLLQFDYLCDEEEDEYTGELKDNKDLRLPNADQYWEYDVSGYGAPEEGVPSAASDLSGSWSGVCSYYGGLQFGWISGLLLDIALELDDDGAITGLGRCGLADCVIKGIHTSDGGGKRVVKLTMLWQAVAWVLWSTSYVLSFEGEYLEEANELSETWTDEGGVRIESALVHMPVDAYRSRADGRPTTWKARWNFALRAILHRVRQRMLSSEHISGKFQAMNRFVALHTRRACRESLFSTQMGALEDDKAEIETLNRSTLPSDVRFYLSVVSLCRRKLRIHYNICCDACDLVIVNDRYTCLQCVYSGLRNQLDLCAACREQTPAIGALTHSSAHTLARIRYHLHDKDKKIVYDNARRALERVRRIVRPLVSADGAEAASGAWSIGCMKCEEFVSLPFWYCSDCYSSESQQDVFLCDCCDRKNQEHAGHVWILIKSDALRPQFSVLERQMKALEQKFADLDDRMGALESRLDMIIATR